MITDTQRRNQILRRISRIPKDKLKELDDYVKSVADRSLDDFYAAEWEGWQGGQAGKPGGWKAGKL